MLRRTLALGISLVLCGIGPARSARAENLGATIAAVPISLIALVATARGCSSDVSAESEFARDGAYVGIGGSYGIEAFNFDGTTGNSGGVTLRTGYRCHPNVGAELQAEYFTGFDAEDPLITPEVDSWVLTANSRLYPLTSLLPGRIQPYLLAGIGAMNADSETGLTMRFGGGLDVYATPHLSLTAGVSYLVPYDAVSKFDTVSLSAGIDYRF